jgi:N-acetylmuramoyl-L-alanine amidase
MTSPYDNNTWDNDSSWWAIIGRVLPFLLFFLIATLGMAGVYFFFSPADGNAEIVAAVRSNGLSAPFYKPAPPRPVSQRLVQSPAPLRIGIISGHRGNDVGAVCDDGLTEAEVNLNIAERVTQSLQARGFRTELLDEFDERLYGFAGTALISIHADSCVYYNEEATGYKVAGSYITDSTLLTSCIEEAYGTATQLPYHANTITPHMTDYHAFREISVGTAAVIIETGFMNLDRELLTTRAEVPAEAILQGILCYIEAIH